MNCQEVADFLDDYVDRQLPWRQRLSFGFHLWLCGACRRYLNSYRKTIKLARHACDEPELSEPLPEDLVQAILAAQRIQQPPD